MQMLLKQHPVETKIAAKTTLRTKQIVCINMPKMPIPNFEPANDRTQDIEALRRDASIDATH
jgi:hypothetical protein